MEIFFNTLHAVIALIGIGTIGFLIISRKLIPSHIIGVITPLVIDIALPCLVFINIITKFQPHTFTTSWWLLPLWWLGFTTIAFVLSFSLSFLSKKEFQREFAMSAFYHNAMFLPIPILAGLYGPDTPLLSYLFIFTMFYPAFIFNTYNLFYSKKKNKTKNIKSIDWKKVFNPVLISTLISIFIVLLNIQNSIPKFILTITRMLGAMTIPLIILIVGGTIYIDFQKRGTIYINEILKFILVKNIIMPIIVLGLLLVIKPPKAISIILILQSCTPPVSAASILAEKEGGNKEIVNQFIFGSFMASIITIPSIMLLYGKFFII